MESLTDGFDSFAVCTEVGVANSGSGSYVDELLLGINNKVEIIGKAENQ